MARQNAREKRITAMGYLEGLGAALTVAATSPDGARTFNAIAGYVGGGLVSTAIAVATAPPPRQPTARRRKQSV